MAFSNNMTKLVNKIENRLGLLMMKLPDKINKNAWAENVIIPDTLVTFSRYYPHQLHYLITPDHPRKDGWIYIDEDFVDEHEILGIKDIDWSRFTQDSFLYQQQLGYGTLDYISQTTGFTFEDIAGISMRADFNSLFSSGIYPEFDPPNRFKLVGLANADIAASVANFYIDIFVVHEPDLTTISPTMMECFEDLAICDVAGWLYHSLKFFNDLETAYANIDLKLDYLEQKANERNEVLEKIKDSYVSASNKNQPMIMVI